MSTSWEPSRNAVHGLIQLIDVLAIALNRFRQLSFGLPPENEPHYRPERQRLWDAYFEVKRAVFPRADTAPQHTAARIAHRAVAELARHGSRDEAAVGDAQQWMTAVGWILVPHAAPKSVLPEAWHPFEQEGEILSQHGTVRQRLFAALARIGQAAPDDVAQRDRLAIRPLVHEGEEPIAQEVLLRWVRETAMSSEPPENQAPSPQFPPAVAQQLEDLRQKSAQFADKVRRNTAALEDARGALEAWLLLASFSGREADRDGRRATDDEAREYYVNLLLELGQRLCAAGYDQRVRALDAGTEAPRLLAVELLRSAVAGDREAVSHLDSAMRAALFVGGAEAVMYIRNELRYEVLGVRPPVPVPTGWEGPRPDRVIRTPADFIAWVDGNLDLLQHFFGGREDRSRGADVRNAHRLLAALGIAHAYPFPPDGMTSGEEEAHLRNLRTICLAMESVKEASGDDGQEASNSHTPSNKSTDGPVAPYRFRWSGVEGEFLRDERRYHRLLVAVWPTFRLRTSTHIKDANKKLEDLGGSTLESRTMQNYARELSKILTERFKFPAGLVLDGSYLVWRDLADTPASS